MIEVHKKILKADAILHSVPLYFWAMTSQMKAYLDRWCAFFDGNWTWQKAYAPKMIVKKIGLITVCGAPDVHTSDPIVHSCRETCKLSGLKLLPVVQVAAYARGEIDRNAKAKKQAYQLGRRIATM